MLWQIPEIVQQWLSGNAYSAVRFSSHQAALLEDLDVKKETWLSDPFTQASETAMASARATIRVENDRIDVRPSPLSLSLSF